MCHRRTICLDTDYIKYAVGIDKPVSYTVYADDKTEQATYLPKGMIHAKEVKRTSLYVPDNNPQKSFEYYTSITDVNSKQWDILHGKEVKFDDDGTISVNGYICVAMGQRYGKVGDKFLIKLSSGKYMKVIMADAKQNKDTCGGWTGKNGHILEMVVWSAPASARGNLCFGGLSAYSGTITEIYKEN